MTDQPHTPTLDAAAVAAVDDYVNRKAEELIIEIFGDLLDDTTTRARLERIMRAHVRSVMTDMSIHLSHTQENHT